MTTDLRALAERLEGATGADRDADRAICLWQRPRATLWTPGWWSGGPDEYWREPDDEKGAHYGPIAHYTSSLDAAVALCERVLPGWIHGHEHTGDPAIADAWVRNPWNDTDAVEALGCTPALALCLAVVRAKLAESE